MSNILSFDEQLGTDPPSRLDIVCTQFLGVPRAAVIAWIKGGQITVNGRPAKPALKVEANDVVHGEGLIAANRVAPLEVSTDPTILYEDDAVIVVNKPVGWTVHEVHKGQRGPFLTDWLVAHDSDSFSYSESRRPGIVHRLDQMTEGVMVVAKTLDALESLKDQFKERTVDKGYYAAVRGNILNEELLVDQPIMRNPKTRNRMVVLPEGKPAISHIKVVKRYHSMTLVEVIPKTGRTHQIRVHLDFIGHPVIGDPMYGNVAGSREGQRLQAYRLGFKHPVTGEAMQFSVPLSERIVK